MGWYTIHHLLRHDGTKSGYKLGIHVLPATKLCTKLTDLLLHGRINGIGIACTLRKSRHAGLRLRDQTEQINLPLLELGQRQHSLLSSRLLVPRYHPLIGTRWTNGLCSRTGRTVHLVLRRLHGWGSKHVHGSRLIRHMLGAETRLLETRKFLLIEHFELAGNVGIVHRWMHHRVHVERRRLHLLLGIHRHIGEVGRYEGLGLVRLRIVENSARMVHALSVKPKGLLKLLNKGLTLTMRESLPSGEFLHLNKEQGKCKHKRNYEKIGSQ
jgi:hypothetical protein